MEPEITLTPMTARMYHAFFRDYQNDADLYLDKSEFREYTYNRETVDAYIQRQIALKRLPFAILYGDEMVGELRFYDIKPHESAVLGITMKSSQYKDHGCHAVDPAADRLNGRHARNRCRKCTAQHEHVFPWEFPFHPQSLLVRVSFTRKVYHILI